MVPALARVVLALLAAPAAAASARPRGREAGSLLQTWSAVLDAGGETPLAKVVGLLKSMQETLEKEMDEDQKLYEKLKCWCETNDWEKGNAIEDNKAKIEQLTADIESLSAKKEELIATIKEVQEKTAANKQSLAEAQAIRDKQLKEFHAMELDSIQALEQMKAALTILGKHHGEGVFQQFSPLSLLSVGGRDEPWTAAHDRATVGRALDEFMRRNDFGLSQVGERAVPSGQLRKQDTLAADGVQATGGWSADEAAVVRRALKAGSAFVQSHHEQSYYPSYTAQSGEIVGILKQLKDEMEADLGESQKQESMRSEEFQILRNAKTAEIEAGEKMEEQKEDELAKTANELAEAKEDLGQEQAILANNEAFLKNVKVTCADADKNWEERKAARQAEIVAVTETIGILTEDEAKDAAAGTYSLLQRGSARRAAAESSEVQHRRREAARALREVAAKTHSPELSMLANTVELDAFAKVKKAIDDMIVMLKKQMEDEVKKNDWCKAEFKENEMSTMKTEDLKADLAAHIAELENTIKTLEQEIAAHRKELERAQAELQGAGLSRKAENLDYQTTVADQTATIAVLKKALTRLSKYYASEALLQRRAGREDPAPGSVAPVAQMTYKASEGASGVMQMLEKLIVEAKALMAESKKSESEAQKAYETVIADTNAAVVALQKQITTKTKVKAKTTKEKQRTEEDLAAAVSELEGLNKYKADLHAECDFSLHNFDTRQDSRGQEIEALQQAKQILNGASLS
ncbi:unnamed protein product [Prorocentrum cordatum]|uniref:Uncharacterized protein n=1 Tax=Prorocentrum cordatum TaxID=2364126 RepID=A0ABN9T7N3_9DINO|nr:unnamed protein product [Polarella glacialis]|mmetsp:Transcript_105380/g.286161  ORF Transcript_105380/g.286161 Transcript_105380/m.286161 type:complete len:751 (-) Transcript_105380:120-2372(-)